LMSRSERMAAPMAETGAETNAVYFDLKSFVL
jgi:hypothetical protein